jgi:hypothetical protein
VVGVEGVAIPTQLLHLWNPLHMLPNRCNHLTTNIFFSFDLIEVANNNTSIIFCPFYNVWVLWACVLTTRKVGCSSLDYLTVEP